MSKIYTIEQVNSYIKNIFVRDCVLGRICIKGEVSNCKYHNSGHIYFSLKDGKSQLNCVMFSGKRLNGLDFKLEDGQSVEADGQIDVYVRDGNYRFYASSIRKSGKGELYEKYNELKEKLYKEGLFDSEHKKKIPAYVKTLGVVTGENAAAMHDIENVTWRRNPYIHIVHAPAIVQGERGAASIVKALKKLDAYGTDVIILGRGGGSIEDLWSFNEEAVVRAVYELKTPVISAVGHEINVALTDYAADLRAPTPSAAAEMAVYEYAALEQHFVDIHSELIYGVMNRIDRAREILANGERNLEYLNPGKTVERKKEKLESVRQRMSELVGRNLNDTIQLLAGLSDEIQNEMHLKLAQTNHRMDIFHEKLRRLSPLEKIESGYGYVSKNGKTVKSVKEATVGDRISITLKDGNLLCNVEKIEHGEL